MSVDAKLLLHALESDVLVVHCAVNGSVITLLKKSSEGFKCNPITRIQFPSIIVNFCSAINGEKLHIVAGTIDGFVGSAIIPLTDIEIVDVVADKSHWDAPFTSIDEIICNSVIKWLDSKSIVQLYLSDNRCKIESLFIVPDNKYVFTSTTEECFALYDESAMWTKNAFKKVSFNMSSSIVTSMIYIEMSKNNEEKNNMTNLMSYIYGKDFVSEDSDLLLLGCHDGAIYFFKLNKLSHAAGSIITLECLRKGSFSRNGILNLVLASNACASYLCLISADEALLLGVQTICNLVVGDERVIPLDENLANTSSFCFIRGLQLLVYLDGCRLYYMTLLRNESNASKFGEIIFDSDVKLLNCISTCPCSTGQCIAFGTSDNISLTYIESSKNCLGEDALKHICNTSFQSGPIEVLHSFVTYEHISGIDEYDSKKRKGREETSANMQNNTIAINKIISVINELVGQEELYRELLAAIELETLQLTSLINVLQNGESIQSEKSHNGIGVHRIWGSMLHISTDVHISCGASGQDVIVSATLTSTSPSLMKALHGKMVIATIATINQLLDQDDGGVVSFSSPLLFHVEGRKNEKNTTIYLCEVTIPLVNCDPSVHVIDLFVNINLANPELLFNFSKKAGLYKTQSMNLPLFGFDGKESCYCPQDCGVNIPLYHGDISLGQLSKCMSSKSYIDQLHLMSMLDKATAGSPSTAGHNLHIVVPHLSNTPSVKNEVINSIQKIKSTLESSKHNSFGTNAFVDTTSMIQPQFIATTNATQDSMIETASCSVRSYDAGSTTSVLLNSASMPLLSSIHADTRKVALNLLDMYCSETNIPDYSDNLRTLREDIYSTPHDVRNIMVECSKIENFCSLSPISSDILMDKCDTTLKSFLDDDKSVRISSARLVSTILELYKKLRESGV